MPCFWRVVRRSCDLGWCRGDLHDVVAPGGLPTTARSSASFMIAASPNEHPYRGLQLINPPRQGCVRCALGFCGPKSSRISQHAL